MFKVCIGEVSATRRHATPRDATRRHTTPRDATQRHATPRDATRRHETPNHDRHMNATTHHRERQLIHDHTASDVDGKTALDWAGITKRTDVVEFLSSLGSGGAGGAEAK